MSQRGCLQHRNRAIECAQPLTTEIRKSPDNQQNRNGHALRCGRTEGRQENQVSFLGPPTVRIDSPEALGSAAGRFKASPRPCAPLLPVVHQTVKLRYRENRDHLYNNDSTDLSTGSYIASGKIRVYDCRKSLKDKGCCFVA